MLPQRIIDRLTAGETQIADRHDDVTVLFSDVVGFTEISARLPTAELIDELNDLFSGFDAICDSTGVEKIKTIGDAYLAIGGLVEGTGDHPTAIAETATRMVELVDVHPWRPAPDGRFGSGSTGARSPLASSARPSSSTTSGARWRNVASRLEAASLPGRIHVSDGLASALRDDYDLEPRGTLDEIKGKGPMATWFGTRSTKPRSV